MFYFHSDSPPHAPLQGLVQNSAVANVCCEQEMLANSPHLRGIWPEQRGAPGGGCSHKGRMGARGPDFPSEMLHHPSCLSQNLLQLPGGSSFSLSPSAHP